jgi:predicted short-subunit dehydrogenase-like oxidoreductase (DUF2520 family)
MATTPTPSGISMRELERDSSLANGPRPGGASLPALAVIGEGRAGTAIAEAAQAEGVDVTLVGRDAAPAAFSAAEVALLCVPDAAIAEAASVAAEAIPPLRFVGHVSGASGLETLKAAADRGAGTFSLHPLQTLTAHDADLVGAACAVDGSSPEAVELATELGSRLGMRPVSISGEHRAAYHAAASIASNFLITLEESAAELLERIGVADAHELLAPLVTRTASNWASDGAGALTGPIVRGDAETVERHREALRDHAPELVDLYEALAARTRAIADGRDQGERERP